MSQFNKFAGGKAAMAGKYDFFWDTMELCDWKKEGDDDRGVKTCHPISLKAG